MDTKLIANQRLAVSNDTDRGLCRAQQFHYLRVTLNKPVEARNEYAYTVTGAKLKGVHRWNPAYSNSPVIGSSVDVNLLKEKVSVDYIGNKIHRNGVLSKILFSNGYYSDGMYYFYVRDYQEDNRIVANKNGTVIQSTEYYSFGLPYAEGYGQGVHPFKYNGKELDMMNRVNLYDYGFRHYESALARFTTIDPLAEKYPWISPYAYCGGNPINRVDPTGMDWYRHDESGAVIWQEGNDGSITINEQVYNNIGETYIQNIGNTTYNYNQNSLETIDYATGAQFEAQVTGTGCKVAADNMTRSSGANPSHGRAGEILMANHDANGVVTTPTTNAVVGVNRMEAAIENGNAITVGVDYKPEQRHNLASNGGDGMTDHFITVVGMIYSVKTGNTTYRFYDPGSRSNGNSLANTMSLQGGFLQGNLSFGRQIPFKVTTIRKNR